MELRERLRRQCPAGQKVRGAAHRELAGARGGLARGAHAHPRTARAGREEHLRLWRVPQRVRQDQSRHARAAGFLRSRRLAHHFGRRRHRMALVRRGGPSARHQSRDRLLRRRARHVVEVEPAGHRHDYKEHDLHQRRPHRRWRCLVGGPHRHAARAPH